MSTQIADCFLGLLIFGKHFYNILYLHGELSLTSQADLCYQRGLPTALPLHHGQHRTIRYTKMLNFEPVNWPQYM